MNRSSILERMKQCVECQHEAYDNRQKYNDTHTSMFEEPLQPEIEPVGSLGPLPTPGHLVGESRSSNAGAP